MLHLVFFSVFNMLTVGEILPVWDMPSAKLIGVLASETLRAEHFHFGELLANVNQPWSCLAAVKIPLLG